MRASIGLLLALALPVVFAAAQPRSIKTLDIYVVDVEGGNATLFVSSGESILIDSGNAGAAAARDADRIMAAVSDAGLEHLSKLSGLKQLYVGDTEVTLEGARKLRESLPGCKIHL